MADDPENMYLTIGYEGRISQIVIRKDEILEKSIVYDKIKSAVDSIITLVI
jgi:hypothetical protein